MGNCLGEPSAPAAGNGAQTREKKGIKVLLLGAGESGKSTIFKQMKIINQNGYSQEECMMFRDIIYGNIIKNMKALVAASVTLSIPIESPDNIPKAQYLNSLENDVLLNVGKVWNQQMGRDIGDLWEDAGIKKTFERRNEFQLDDSAPYFFGALNRINQQDYIPTETDVLRSRVKTTGIVEMDVVFDGVSVKFIDVGGQRNERKKWIHCFEGVTAVIFVSSLSEYDQKCYEDDSTNRMRESMLLFDEICNSRWFFDTSVILFMNKVDLFKNKIEKVDLNVCFEEYSGGCNFEKASEYIKSKYQELNKHKETKQIFAHFTCATDTDIMRTVFGSIKQIILQKQNQAV